jgi:hypothetical protein
MKQAAQSGLASRALGGLNSLFGNQDPMLARQLGTEQILKETQEQLGSDANNPAKLYATLADNLSKKGRDREAFQVRQYAGTAIAGAADIGYKRSLTAQAEATTTEKTANLQAQTEQRVGSIANGAQKAIMNATSPEAAEGYWTASMSRLDSLGMDTTALRNTPVEERGNALTNIVDQTTSETERVKGDLANTKNAITANQQELANKRNERKDALAEASDKWKRIASDRNSTTAEVRAATAKVDSIQNSMNKLMVQQASSTRRIAIAALKDKTSSRGIKQYLTTELEIPASSLQTGVNLMNTYLRQNLSKVNKETGMPMYEPYEAEDLAKKQFGEHVTTKKSWGMSTTVLSTKPKKPIVIN